MLMVCGFFVFLVEAIIIRYFERYAWRNRVMLPWMTLVAVFKGCTLLILGIIIDQNVEEKQRRFEAAA
jgi:uncharacterized membrane protein